MSNHEGYLTTHVLDTAKGCPAKGISITLFKVSGHAREEIASTFTNDDGRTDSPILPKDKFTIGQYELVFAVADYLKANNQVSTSEQNLFLSEIPIRFGINDASAHYHVPLLLSPYGYSTYRGS
jgi:5-hydroxyisourate hydrolase